MVESGDYMLMGEYHHNIDDKKRLIIPSKFRDELGSEVIITRGLENCLFVYSVDNFNKITSKLEALPFTKKDARNFNRFFLSGASNAEFDKQGRIVIPTPLYDYANIDKECVILGVGNRLEIWNYSSWEEFFNSNADAMADIAENLFESEL